MWSNLTDIHGTTEAVVIPEDGMVSVSVPLGIELCAYVNGKEVPVHHVHVKEGYSIYFELKSHEGMPASVVITYNDETSILEVLPSTKVISDYKKPITNIKEKEMTPAETINLFSNPGMGGAGAGAGAGLGAGLLGGVLGGALLGGRRGILGGEDGVVGTNVVSPALLASSLADVTSSLQNSAIQQTLGDIKAAVPLAEGQVQLALAGAQADINSNISTSLQTAINGQANINSNISNAIATSLASQSAIKETILTTGAALGQAIANSQYNVTTAVRDDGDKTRALLISQNDAMLNRQLATAEAALLEQRAIGRSRDVEVNVTQTVNQNQAQLQAQAQQQQQFLITNNLLQAILSQAQVAQATNQSLIIGNTGGVIGGAQTANPVNVRA